MRVQAAAAAAVAGGWQCCGAVLFSLALNHKQMAMYYAPAFFAHLLGWALQHPSPSGKVHAVASLQALGLQSCGWMQSAMDPGAVVLLALSVRHSSRRIPLPVGEVITLWLSIAG